MTTFTKGTANTFVYGDKIVTKTGKPLTSVPPVMSATGGTVTTDGDYKIHTFSSAGSHSFTVTSGGDASALIVGGGGNGAGGGGTSASFSGGGGGGGKVREISISSIEPGTYSVVVGAPGNTSSFYGTSSAGGNSATGKVGGSSASGQPGGTGTPVAGGGGGGGGETGAGTDSSGPNQGGVGGLGYKSSISGTLLGYGGGGGGGGFWGQVGNDGGGEGDGPASDEFGWSYTAVRGGGGGGREYRRSPGFSGSPGIVIIRYKYK